MKDKDVLATVYKRNIANTGKTLWHTVKAGKFLSRKKVEFNFSTVFTGLLMILILVLIFLDLALLCWGIIISVICAFTLVKENLPVSKAILR